MKKDIHYFKNKKNNKIPIAALIAYDFPVKQFLNNDIVGISSEVFKHVHRYLDLNSLIIEAVTEFKNDVENKRFTVEDNLRHLSVDDYQYLMAAMNK